MKKLAILVAAIACSVAANAQAVYGYGATITAGTYTEITDGTVLAKATDEGIATVYDDSGDITSTMGYKVIFASGLKGTYTDTEGNEVSAFTEAGIPIGFTFNLAGENYTHFAVSTDGIVYLGNETITCTPEDGRYAFNRENDNNFVACIPWNNVIAEEGTEISYKVVGEEPNRTLVVQYKNWGWRTSSWAAGSQVLDLQIRLNEGSNSVDYVFSNTASFENSINARIGIKSNEVVTISGNSAEYVIELDPSTFSVANDVTDGTTVTFTAPTDCVAPETQPTDLVLTATSDQIVGSFTKNGADMYLVTYTTEDASNATPTNGTVYAEGDVIGNSTVVGYSDYSNLSEFEVFECTAATKYSFNVYAVSAFGYNGPVYNTNDPLSASVYTSPLAPASLTISNITFDSVNISATANEASNNILVAYTTELVRSSYGDYPAIGNLSGEYKAGDELTLTVEETEYKGKVAYFGPSVENLTVSGLDHSTGYYFVALSYDATCGYSSNTKECPISTICKLPYTANFSTAKDRLLDGDNGLPPGWTEVEPTNGTITAKATTKVTSEDVDGWVLLMSGASRSANTETGLEFITNLPAILIDKRAAVASFEYSWFTALTRFGNAPYTEWVEGDKLALQVSTDGVTYKDLVAYDSTSRPEVTELTQFTKMEGDLSKYEGQTVYLRIYWKSLASDFWKQPGNLVVKNFTIDGREIPAIPEVLVKNITHISALVQWRGQQSSYEVAFGKSGEEPTMSVINGVAEENNTIELTDLTAETTYEVKVRGIAGENDFSDWSEVVTFTTTAWPECQKPTNLQANVDKFVDEGIVELTWEGNEEHTSWEVRYRESLSTSYTNIANLVETNTTLTGLNHSTAYLWSVRAECIADRTTAWSSQGSFETPVIDGIESVAVAEDMSVTTSGKYINVINGKVYVENVVVFDANGRTIASVDVDGYDNVIIPVSQTGVAIVMVNTANKTFTYKVAVK